MIAEIVHHCNHERLHPSLSYLRLADYSPRDPDELLAERRRKLLEPREPRKQENLKLQQRLIPWMETENVAQPTGRCVSL